LWQTFLTELRQQQKQVRWQNRAGCGFSLNADESGQVMLQCNFCIVSGSISLYAELGTLLPTSNFQWFATFVSYPSTDILGFLSLENFPLTTKVTLDNRHKHWNRQLERTFYKTKSDKSIRIFRIKTSVPTGTFNSLWEIILERWCRMKISVFPLQ
jgi:hypothetical protein